jgi:hypothetical protein
VEENLAALIKALDTTPNLKVWLMGAPKGDTWINIHSNTGKLHTVFLIPNDDRHTPSSDLAWKVVPAGACFVYPFVPSANTWKTSKIYHLNQLGFTCCFCSGSAQDLSEALQIAIII